MNFSNKTDNIPKYYLGYVGIFVLTCLIVPLFVSSNDSIDFSEGVLYAENPQSKIVAPTDVNIAAIHVREGEKVCVGDTLMELEAPRLCSELASMEYSINNLRQRMDLLINLKKSLEDKVQLSTQLLAVDIDNYNAKSRYLETSSDLGETKSELDLNNLAIAGINFLTDSNLYIKGAISKQEYLDQKKRYMDIKRRYLDYSMETAQTNQKIKENNNAKLSKRLATSQRTNDIRTEIIKLDLEYNQLKNKLAEDSLTLAFLRQEVDALTVTAQSEGSVIFLNNIVQQASLIRKGEPLIIVAPKSESFYAKIILPENKVARISNGLDVNIKLKAYDYKKFGLLRGNITYVSSSEIDENYYCIVRLKDYKSVFNLKSGYSVKGDIILEEMRLYEFVIRKIFHPND